MVFFAMVHRHMLNGDEFVLLFQATELKREWFSCLGNVFIADNSMTILTGLLQPKIWTGRDNFLKLEAITI